MSLYGAIVDGRRIRLGSIPGGPAGLAVARSLLLDAQNVTFTGTGTVKFPEMDAVLFSIIDQVTGVSPGVGASTFTYTVTGNVVNLFSWQPTSNANPTLVAGTNPATVSVVAVGTRRGGLTGV